MKFRLAKKILINNGYNIIKSAHSNHVKFYNHNGSHISIPYHKDFTFLKFRTTFFEEWRLYNFLRFLILRK